MKLIGIDFGSKRVGVAMSDESGNFALPLSVLQNSEQVVKEISELAVKNNVKKIILGESRDFKGMPNAIFEAAQKFKVNMEKQGFEVIYEPEYMTSAEAERIQGNNEMLDASAAAIILQSYIDKHATPTQS